MTTTNGAETELLYEARVESDARYRALVSNMLQAVTCVSVIFDEHGEALDYMYVAVNAAFERASGLTDVVGKRVSDLVPGVRESSPELFEVYGRVARTGVPEIFEFEFKPLAQWRRVSTYSPSPGIVVAVFDDITERRRSERALHLFRSLLDRSNDMILVVDPETGRLLDVNDACSRLLGYSRDELLTLSVSDVDPTIDAEKFARFGSMLRSSGTARLEGLNRRKDGSTFPVEVSISLAELDRPYAVSVARDISDRRRLEAERTLQAAALNSSADPIVITERDGTVAWANDAFMTTTGYTRDEVVGRNPRALVKSGVQDQAFYADMWNTALSGRVWKGELTNRRKDGSLYPEFQTITPVRGERGDISHLVAVKRDLTHEKKLQAQLLQAQKMESVGRLAGGVAHDFNNLLMVMNGWTEMALADLPPDHEVRASLESVLNAGQGAARLTRQLLAFSRQQVVEPEVFAVNTLVTDMNKMLLRLLGEDICLTTRPSEEAGLVCMDRGQLEQVLMNLAVNARDAMPRGGTLLVETSNVAVTAADFQGHPDIKPGDYVVLAVTDTGTGMSESVRAHLFEPFFTTKEKGKGTGLGLATTYGIVHQAGGHLEVLSVLGAGTTMTILLPRTSATAVAAGPKPRRTARVGVETVLLVEDDGSVREVVERMLRSRGYRVLTARSGDEALELLEARESPVHLLITDIVLTGALNGCELAAQVVAKHPGVKVLYVSGYTADVTMRYGTIEQEAALLQKPFAAEALTVKVRQILDEEC